MTDFAARRDSPGWLPVLAFWSAVWAIFALTRLTLLFWLRERRPDSTELVALLDYAILYGMMAVLTPVIFRLSRRLPVTRRNWTWTVPAHLAIGAVVVAASMVLMFFLHNQYAHPPAEAHVWTPSVISRQVIQYGYHFQLVFYMGILAAGFGFHSYQDLQRQRLAAAHMRAQLSDARMDALRMQLNPHFLFNTLNSIADLTDEDPREARRTIARFASLLRTVLESSGQHEVHLADELRFIREYLDIAQMRFGERLTVRIDADAGTEQLLVPNLVLQPIVENALEHGIARTLARGTIGIDARLRSDRLHLSVTDTGAASIDEIREGIGITNTRARLRELYGSAASLELRRRDGSGLLVELTFPARARLDASAAGQRDAQA